MVSSCPAAAYASQGPDWLAAFALCPPGWVNPLLGLLGVVVGLVVLLRLRARGWELDVETQRVMLTIAATIAAVLVATLALVGHDGTSYLEDVTYGVLVGFIGGQVVGRWPIGRRLNGMLPPLEIEERLMVGWGAVVVLVVLGPALVGPSTPMLRLGRRWLLVLAVVMMFYNARELTEA